MSSNRKLQAEVERVLKRIGEGLEVFDEIWEKLKSAMNQSQKDKWESDLKKEIKKLQRLREQVKTWATSSSEIRDKTPLLKARKDVETRMERFKELEREMKTKAYSREGLSKNSKLSEEEQAAEDCKAWLSDKIDEIKDQLESAEADVESHSSTSKKKAKHADKIKMLEERIGTYQWHIEKLELIIRALDNNLVEVADVNEIKEDINYFIESNQEADFYNDMDVYDPLELEEKMAQAIVHVPSMAPPSVASGDADDYSEASGGASKPKKEKKGGEEEGEAPKKKKDKKKRDKEKEKEHDVLLAQQQQRQAILAQQTAVQKAKKEAQQQQRLQELQRQQEEAERFKDGSGLPISLESEQEPSTIEESVPTVGEVSLPIESLPPTPPPGVPGLDPTTEEIPSAVIQDPLGAINQPQQINLSQQALPPMELPQTGSIGFGAAGAQVGQVPPAAQVPTNQQGKQQSSTSQPQQRTPRQQIQMPLLDNRQRMLLLDSSLLNCPQPSDSERPKVYYPKQPIATPASFPSNPPPQLETPELFERLDTDTLFFIFFHQQGTYQQYLASRELKRQSWRFHKKYRTWFQRHQDPTASTDEYEVGTYVYFDYETGWCQRIKTDFTFDYQFLE